MGLYSTRGSMAHGSSIVLKTDTRWKSRSEGRLNILPEIDAVGQHACSSRVDLYENTRHIVFGFAALKPFYSLRDHFITPFTYSVSNIYTFRRDGPHF